MTNPFSGFPEPTSNYTRLPNALIDALPLITSQAELKVILYVLRHTWGYHDEYKRITMEEFANGRKRKDGTRIDNGTGLTEKSLRLGIKNAIAHGFITQEVAGDPGRIINYYSLKMTEPTADTGIQSIPLPKPDGDTKYPPIIERNCIERNYNCAASAQESETMEGHTKKESHDVPFWLHDDFGNQEKYPSPWDTTAQTNAMTHTEAAAIIFGDTYARREGDPPTPPRPHPTSPDDFPGWWAKLQSIAGLRLDADDVALLRQIAQTPVTADLSIPRFEKLFCIAVTGYLMQQLLQPVDATVDPIQWTVSPFGKWIVDHYQQSTLSDEPLTPEEIAHGQALAQEYGLEQSSYHRDNLTDTANVATRNISVTEQSSTTSNTLPVWCTPRCLSILADLSIVKQRKPNRFISDEQQAYIILENNRLLYTAGFGRYSLTESGKQFCSEHPEVQEYIRRQQPKAPAPAKPKTKRKRKTQDAPTEAPPETAAIVANLSQCLYGTPLAQVTVSANRSHLLAVGWEWLAVGTAADVLLVQEYIQSEMPFAKGWTAQGYLNQLDKARAWKRNGGGKREEVYPEIVGGAANDDYEAEE